VKACAAQYYHVCSALSQVLEALALLRAAGVDVVTLGQYMRPTKRHMPVSEYVTPAAFDAYADEARRMGFLYAAAGPLVRSSYRAGEFYLKNVLRGRAAAGDSSAAAAAPEGIGGGGTEAGVAAAAATGG
jgi:lipoyl synthase